MRTHRIAVAARPWRTGSIEVGVATLAVARVEGVSRQRKGTLAVDLFFGAPSGSAVVPAVVVDPPMLLARERDALLWPAGTEDLAADGALAEIEDAVVTALAPAVRELAWIDERILRFADASLFDEARAAAAFGAAPYRESLLALAPYLYARRLCAGRRVLLDAAGAPGGARVLAQTALAVVVPPERLDASALWYGVEAGGPGGEPEVAIVDGDGAAAAPTVLRLDGRAGVVVGAAAPYPLDVAPTFDPLEAPPARLFAVERAAEPALRSLRIPAPRGGGGSAGRIRILAGRRDAAHRPGADRDEAAALAAALGAEGFDAAVVATAREAVDADLVHVVGLADGGFVREVADAAREGGVPFAVHAYAEDVAHEGYWGAAVTRFCFEYGPDERSVGEYLKLLARRLVAIGALTAASGYVDPAARLDDARRVAADAGVIFAQSEEEARLLERLGLSVRPVVVPPLLGADAEPAAIGARVGPDPFVLVHAPIGPEANQLLVARAVADADLPLVVAGPVADAAYLERTREFGGPRLVVLPEPDPATAAALYAAAAVYVDASWIGNGLARIARAGVHGCELVLANRRLTGDLLPGEGPRWADPADAASLTRAVGEAWDAAIVRAGAPGETARHLATRVEPRDALAAIVAGYAALAQPVS